MMTIPPYCDDPERARPYFRKLRQLRDSLRDSLDRPLPVLSMGMSHDFEVAIEEGATEIRIGTAIFGDRDASWLTRRSQFGQGLALGLHPERQKRRPIEKGNGGKRHRDADGVKMGHARAHEERKSGADESANRGIESESAAANLRRILLGNP